MVRVFFVLAFLAVAVAVALLGDGSPGDWGLSAVFSMASLAAVYLEGATFAAPE